MPSKLITTFEEFEKHFESFKSKGYNLLDKVGQPIINKGALVLEEGIHRAIFINGVTTADLVKKDGSLIFFYFIECQLSEQIVYVTVTKETAFLALSINIGQVVELYILNTGNDISAYLNPFDLKYFQYREPPSFISRLKHKNDKYIICPRDGDIVKFNNGRFLYIIEGLHYSSLVFSFNLRSTTGEYYKMKILICQETKNEHNVLSKNLRGYLIDVENVNIDTYYTDREILDIRTITRVNLRIHDFENLPPDPKNYPLPFTPIKVNKVADLPVEEWYDIPEYENLYSISNFGRIKSKNYQGYLFNEGILTSKEIKLSKNLNKEYFSRKEILTHAQQNFSSLITVIDPTKTGSTIIEKIYQDQYEEGVWYFILSVRKYDVFTFCYFLDYEAATQALIILSYYLEELPIHYIQGN